MSDDSDDMKAAYQEMEELLKKTEEQILQKKDNTLIPVFVKEFKRTYDELIVNLLNI